MTEREAKENPMIQISSHRTLLHCAWLALFACASVISPPATAAGYTLTTVAEDFDHPWSVAQMPDRSFLVTERTGQLLRVTPDGKRSVIEGVPPSYFAGQGGLLDVVLHPDFATNRVIYLSYAHGSPDANGTAITRATLRDSRLENAEQILLVVPLKSTPQHYGGKMLFLPDGSLLLSTGEGFDYRESAQDLGSELGKILRINDDGSVPENNPFADKHSRRIWTYGHRNPQGLILDGVTGKVYLHEHGPRGGDEINVIVPGVNYGWPAISYGRDYSGAQVSPFTAAEGMEQPLHYWVPSIAPSGMAWYGADAFPQWQGDLLIGALVDKEVRRVDIEDGKVLGEESLFRELDARIRDVRVGLDGDLYLLTDGENGKLVRVSPAGR
jgi:glucose/arabinose dehydrogenase